MNLTEREQIGKFLTRGIVLETDDYRKYKKHGGALMPNLIDNHIMKVPPQEDPHVLFMLTDIAAHFYHLDEAGAAEPEQSADDSACSLVGLRIEGEFTMDNNEKANNVSGLDLWRCILENCMIEMMEVLRMEFDHLCIQNLLGQMHETKHEVNVENKFAKFNFEAIKDMYNVGEDSSPRSLTRYIPVNATHPLYKDGYKANSLAAEKLTVGKVALASDALGRVYGQKILIVPQQYVIDLALERNVLNPESRISDALALSPDITMYILLFDVIVIGIPNMHFPPNLGNGKAHWVNEDNGGGDVKMLTTNAAIEKNAKVDYGIMFIAGGKSLKIAEEVNPATPSRKIDGNQGMMSGQQVYDSQNLPTRLIPLFAPVGIGGEGYRVRLNQIYWFSRPRLENVVAIELNPGFNKINEL